MALQFNRFNNIYPDKDSAIDLLNSISRSYSEGITVRYYEEDGVSLGIVLALYKSEEKGDYDIIYESSNKEEDTSFRIFRSTRQYDGQPDKECIMIALFGEKPINRDMVIISSISGDTTVTYIYFEGEWIRIGSDGLGLQVLDTDTINLTIQEDEEVGTSKILSAEVKLDNSSLIFDSEVNGIRVNKIYGGTF